MPTTETRLQWYRIAQEDELPVGHDPIQWTVSLS